MTKTLNPLPACHICQSRALHLLQQFPLLHRVSSDCQPINPGGELAICMNCGGVQKPITPAWQEMVNKIYKNYQIYHQSSGKEQQVFNQQTGSHTSRSTQLLAKVLQRAPLPDAGRMLDVGCGNGATLRAFNELRPAWQLTGTELAENCAPDILAIPGVEAFHAGPAHEANGPFDLISLIHVLEHIPQPGPFLQTLRPHLSDTGRILIEVPDHQTNPFDLLIADHSSHFTPATLQTVLKQAHMAIHFIDSNIVPKELTAVSHRNKTDDAPSATVHEPLTPLSADEAQMNLARVTNSITWLVNLAAQAKELASRGPVGVFGTSIAGTWLGATLGDQVAFYVDEDTARHGRRFMGRPVMGVDHAPAGVPVLLALAPKVATEVARRLSVPHLNWVLPAQAMDKPE